MTGTLEHLDPATLLVGDNVRDDAVLDNQFLASVRHIRRPAVLNTHCTRLERRRRCLHVVSP
jgi:hypothetical protein